MIRFEHVHCDACKILTTLKFAFLFVKITQSFNFIESSHPNIFRHTKYSFILPHICTLLGRNSSVGIATRYGLDGPGIESRWGRGFPHPSRPALGPTLLPVQWTPGTFPGGKTAWGVVLTTHSI